MIASEIDGIYQSLFVHSIAFHQMISKVLDHSEKKYTIITGLWKVFAVLLEYCCKLDYKMIIATLNIEKKEELEELDESYRNQLAFFEENQKALENQLKETKDQVRKLQRQLDFEIQKKEELEDELMQKGSGHEEEVSTRIMFESKVNQMYARQRDIENKCMFMQETIDDLKKNLETKSGLLQKEKNNYDQMLGLKEKAELDYKRLDEKTKQLEITNESLEKRLNEAYLKLEGLTHDMSAATAISSEAQNVITQRRIEIEDQKFELELKIATIAKLNTMIEELRAEKNIFLKRTIELEALYTDECGKNQHYKQEYARIKESDNFYAMESMKYKDQTEALRNECEELKEDKNKLKIQLEGLIQGYEQLKVQVKKSQERIEEMNKGRRVVEEQNEFLNSRLSEKTHELKDARSMNLELKDDMEKLKTREGTLEGEVTTLTIKLRSLEKQYEANKDTMQAKINSLSDIINSEKKIRENWILKFEEEQKTLSTSNRLLLSTQDQQNELQMKFHSCTLLLDEKTQKLNIQITKCSEQLEEILELKAFQEELQRKNKTLQMLYDNSERERLSMIQNHAKEIDSLNQLHSEVRESLLLGIEEIRVYALANLQKFLEKAKDFEDLSERHKALTALQADTAEKLVVSTQQWNGNAMYSEDLLCVFRKTVDELQDLIAKHDQLNEVFQELSMEHTHFLSLVPEELKNEEDPFAVLTGQVSDLEQTLKEIEFFKANMIDFEVQYDTITITFDENTQTDIGFSFFEKSRRMSGGGTPQSGSQRVYSAKSKDAPAIIHEFQQKRKDKSLPRHADSGFREETPVNMASVYNQ